jgi:hypothetical protein
MEISDKEVLAMDSFQAELLVRLPLAQAVLKMFEYVFDSPWLEDLYARHRGRGYLRQLRFDQLVYLLRDALVVDGGSGRQSFQRAHRDGTLPVAIQNAYAKLARLPLALSMALVGQAGPRLASLLPPEDSLGTPLPASLATLEVTVIDGKKIKHATKRLKPLRGLPGALLGGKVLVALALRKGLAVGMNADPDGERNDLPLVPALVSQVRSRQSGPILWIADRQFVDFKLWPLLTEGQDQFLIRCSRKIAFAADVQRPAQEGIDPQGRRYLQQWGWVGGEKQKQRPYVRRIVLPLPEDDLILVTSLLDEIRYPAEDLLEAYRQRWGIEQMFQQVTEVIHLQRLIGSTPQAMIFQAALCFLLYDLIQVVKAHVAVAGQKTPQQVSGELLFRDVHEELAAWARLGDPALTAGLLPKCPDARSLRDWLATTLRLTWTDRWIKAPNTHRHPQKHSKVPPGHSGHMSVWRILQTIGPKHDSRS